MATKINLNPTIRFEESKGKEFPDWKPYLLGELITNKAKKYNPKVEQNNYPCIELEHIESDTGRLVGCTYSSEQESIKNIFEIGDVLYGKLRPYLNKYYFARFNGICSSEIWVLKSVSSKLVNPFLYYLIQTSRYSKEVSKSSGSKMPRADWEMISNAEFNLPSPIEQHKIANFFSLLDSRIENQQQKVEEWRAYKKGMIQKLFSRELRFKNEGGEEFPEWEERFIGEIANVSTGNKDTQNKVDGGRYPFFVRSNNVESINSFSFDGEAILTAGDGVGVGKVFHYINGKFDFHQRVYKISDFQGCIGRFLYYYFSENFLREAMKYNAKTSVDSVRREMITKMIVPLPSLDEQKKIAKVLSLIEAKVEKEEMKLHYLIAQKKGLMQKMFI